MNQNDDQKEDQGSSPHGRRGSPGQAWRPLLSAPACGRCPSVSHLYEQVFGWKIHGRDTGHPGFDDGTGHVSGAWVTDQAISREPGLLPDISVDRIDDIIEQIEARGGEVIKAPYPEGNLWVVTFRDPEGLVISLTLNLTLGTHQVQDVLLPP